MSTIYPEDDRLWTVFEAAEFLGLSSGGLYHLVAQQRVPVLKLSARCIRFSRKALLEWLGEMAQPASGELWQKK